MTPPLPALSDRLLGHLQEVGRDRDPYFASQGHFYVQHYISQQLAQWGTVQFHSFWVHGRCHYNLVLDLPGQRSDGPPILVGAHYDAVMGSPGADDNATGIAVLLELARAFAIAPARSPIRLVAFDLEESGLVGSVAYVRDLVQQQQPLKLMLSLEMLGYCDPSPHSQHYPPGLRWFYPHQGDFIALIGNWKLIPVLMRLRRAMRQGGPVPCEWLPVVNQGRIVADTRRSDHAPFWDAGYPAILVTDTADLRNPHYHRASDRLDTLNLDFLTGVCQGLIHGLRSL